MIFTKNKILFLCCLFSLIAASFHCIGIFYKINDVPIWRHIIFFLIDLYCAYGFFKKPKYFIWIFFLLLIQQYYSHAYFLLKMWNLYHKIHWISILVLSALPIGQICLIWDYRKSKI